MYQKPDHTNVSMALSEVLAEIGLNDVIVNKRRRAHLVTESMRTVFVKMLEWYDRVYMFGSQSEGTTTIGLKSDTDIVICSGVFHVIHEWKEWKHGVRNVLMVESEATQPGYCMLQMLQFDAPLPETETVHTEGVRDRQGRIFLRNTVALIHRRGVEQHGPAFSRQGQNGFLPADFVPALTCTSQLLVVQQWLSQLYGPWPSEDMKRDIADSQCFLVPVGSKRSPNEGLEWRISTSLAERCLMFNLNGTQLKVYVLMKMLLKTSINYNVPEESHVSSFMCKTVVLHCVQNTYYDLWQSHTLIQCLMFSLSTLCVCVVNENCPHFIIRSNNLMAGRFTNQAKCQVQENLQMLLNDIVSHGILSLHIDGVATRLMLKFSPVMYCIGNGASNRETQTICAGLLISCAMQTRDSVQVVLHSLTENIHIGSVILLQQYLQRLEYVYSSGNNIVRFACGLLKPYICTLLGSRLASESIQSSNIISHEALTFFSLGLISDVSSSKLKLASAFFSAGDMKRAELILRDLEGTYDVNACETACVCTLDIRKVMPPTRRVALSQASDESDIQKMTSACVPFIRDEKHCIPKELHYEMYRSTQEDLQYRKNEEYWMDWAVVDSLPYLHFLCYKVYGCLQRREDQQRALYNLLSAIQTEPNLTHKETALNLLGQCMEQEKRWNYALQCYSWSLNIRPRNNVAKVHICRLLSIGLRQLHS